MKMNEYFNKIMKQDELRNVLEKIINKKEEDSQVLDIMDQINTLHIHDNNKKDVRDIYIASYGEDCVGLFTKTSYENWDKAFLANGILTRHECYISLDGRYFANLLVSLDANKIDNWFNIGRKFTINNNEYIVNCKMNDVIAFDDLRAILKEENIILDYEDGVASLSEIFDLLEYARNYFQKNKENIKVKKLK